MKKPEKTLKQKFLSKIAKESGIYFYKTASEEHKEITRNVLEICSEIKAELDEIDKLEDKTNYN